MTANSRLITGACLLLNVAGAQQTQTTYGFATEQYIIEMTIVFLEPYAGRRLVFYSSVNPQKPLCYSGDGTLGKCLNSFVGAAAVVRYSVRHPDGNPPDRTAIREHVAVLAQSSGLPERPSVIKTVELANGIGSDLQVFGYDESDVKKSERIAVRLQASHALWRLYRQELYIAAEEKPFAVVEWKHTLDRIRILRLHSPARAR